MYTIVGTDSWTYTDCHPASVGTGSLIMPTTAGPANPGMVAKQLVIPNKMPAYCGAMSKWLQLNPEKLAPLKPFVEEKIC